MARPAGRELPGPRVARPASCPGPRDRPGRGIARAARSPRGRELPDRCPGPRDRPGAASCPIGARFESTSCRSRSDADTTPTGRPFWIAFCPPSGHVRPIDTATQRSAAISDRIGLHLSPIAPRGWPHGRICGRNRASPTARAGTPASKRRICPPAGQSGVPRRQSGQGRPRRGHRRRTSPATHIPGVALLAQDRVAAQVSAVRFRRARSKTRSASGPNRTKTARSIECARTMPSRTAARATAAARSIG